jgi:hypothetical protein
MKDRFTFGVSTAQQPMDIDREKMKNIPLISLLKISEPLAALLHKPKELYNDTRRNNKSIS